MRTTPAFLAMFLALAATASASIITVNYSGVITQVPIDDIFGDIAPGTPFQGSYTFDSSSADLIPANNTTGSYSFTAPLGLTAVIGTHTFDAAGLLSIGIVNSLIDQYTVFAQTPGAGLTISLFLQDNSAAVFSNDQLPSSALPIAAFTQTEFHLALVLDGAELQADGQLNGITTVPEPAYLCAALAALLLLRCCFATLHKH